MLDTRVTIRYIGGCDRAAAIYQAYDCCKIESVMLQKFEKIPQYFNLLMLYAARLDSQAKAARQNIGYARLSFIRQEQWLLLLLTYSLCCGFLMFACVWVV